MAADGERALGVERPASGTRSRFPLRLVLVLTDVALINAGFALAYWARYQLQLGREVAVNDFMPWSSYWLIELALTAALMLVYWLRGLYGERARQTWADELGIVVSGTLIGIAVMIVAVFYFRPLAYSRLIFVYAWVFIVALLVLARVVERSVRAYRWRRGIGLRKVIVVGGGQVGRLILQNIVAQPHLGYRVVGVVDDERSDALGRFEWLGRTEAIPELISSYEVDEVIVALPSAASRKIVEILLDCEREHVSFRLVPDFYELSLNQVDVRQLNGIPLIGLREPSLGGSAVVMKRLMDVLGSLFVLAVLSPILGLVALAIRLESPGPIIVSHTRLGRFGKPFVFFKFRSMWADADAQLEKLRALNEADGPIFKMRNDPRRTRVGKIIRRLSVDELPQLYNVLRGDMSLVGPRPPFPHEVERYEDWQRKRLETTPGLTGLWQVSGRSDLSFDEMALLDIWYIDNWSLGLDLKILVQTVPAVLLGSGAY